MLPIDLEVGRINDACACSRRDHFLGLSFADLEIVIEKTSRIDWHGFPAFADVLNREIQEFDFLAGPAFTRVPYEAFCLDAACPQLTGPAKANKPPTKRMRVELFFMSGNFRAFRERRQDRSIVTRGNLSSSQIVFCGATAGSSSDAIVTSIVSESFASSKNKCVPQQAAKERIRFACATLRGLPFGRTRTSPAIDAMTQIEYRFPLVEVRYLVATDHPYYVCFLFATGLRLNASTVQDSM